MGFNTRPKDLADLARWDADLKISCRRCGRSAVFDLLPILNLFRGKGWNTTWDLVAGRFVCRGTAEAPGCGSRNVRAGMVPHHRPTPPKPALTARDVREIVRRNRR